MFRCSFLHHLQGMKWPVHTQHTKRHHSEDNVFVHSATTNYHNNKTAQQIPYQQTTHYIIVLIESIANFNMHCPKLNLGSSRTTRGYVAAECSSVDAPWCSLSNNVQSSLDCGRPDCSGNVLYSRSFLFGTKFRWREYLRYTEQQKRGNRYGHSAPEKM
jgi:hypothetical protein